MTIELLTPFTKVELEPEIKEKKRKQVGILGGNFNPVHNAHLIVADQVRQQLGLDQVLLMPEYQPPHVDKKETIPEHHRLKMLELAIEGIDGLVIETIELERKGISYTYDTMKILTEQHPDTDYYFIIGATWLTICLSGTELMNWLTWFSLWGFSVHATRQGLPIQLSGWTYRSWISRPAWCGTSLPKVGNPTFSYLSQC